jgi:hypothetical protein
MHYRARSYDPRVGRFAQKDPKLSESLERHYSYSALRPTQLGDPSGEIVVFVHGIGTSQSRNKIGAVVEGMNERWKHLGKAEQHVIHFLYGPANIWDPNDQNSTRNIEAAKKLKERVDLLTVERDRLAGAGKSRREPIFVLAYSNGAIVTTFALQYGMTVDGVVFIGAALENDYDLSDLDRRTPFIRNVWSTSDGTTAWCDGAGYQGFSDAVRKNAPYLSDVELPNVKHSIDDSSKTACMSPDKLRPLWRNRRNPRSIEWMTALLGADYYAPYFQTDVGTLSAEYTRKSGLQLSEYESGIK